MKCGLIDPSKAIPGIDSVLHSADDNDMSVDQLQKKVHRENREKLVWLKERLNDKGIFHEVLLDNRGVRLIIRQKTEHVLVEAFCYIRLSKHAGQITHSAVVQCVSDDFKEI